MQNASPPHQAHSQNGPTYQAMSRMAGVHPQMQHQHGMAQYPGAAGLSSGMAGHMGYVGNPALYASQNPIDPSIIMDLINLGRGNNNTPHPESVPAAPSSRKQNADWADWAQQTNEATKGQAELTQSKSRPKPVSTTSGLFVQNGQPLTFCIDAEIGKSGKALRDQVKVGAYMVSAELRSYTNA